MNPKQFFKRWIEGIKNITPLQQLSAELLGIRGNIFGMIFAMAFLLYNGMWFFIIFMIFTTFLQVVGYIGTKQKYETMKALLEPDKTAKEESEDLLDHLGGTK